MFFLGDGDPGPPRKRIILVNSALAAGGTLALGEYMDITLPLDYTAIERILPHRYPFLLVDRVTELEPDKRIVGIKNITLNERYLAHRAGEAPVLPPSVLTEAVAQVGAILILVKPENREKIPYFMGIQRVRYRRPVHPGDVVVIEAIVNRLRSRMGVLRGIARVDGKVVLEGTMTFALGPRTPEHAKAGSPQALPRSRLHDQQHHADFRGARGPHRPLLSGHEVAVRYRAPRARAASSHPRFIDPRRAGDTARVALERTGLGHCRTGVADRRQHVEGEHPFLERRALAPQVGRRVSSHSLPACCTQKPADEIVNSRVGDRPLRWVIAKNGIPWKSTLAIPGSASNCRSKTRWPASCAPKATAASRRNNPVVFARLGAGSAMRTCARDRTNPTQQRHHDEHGDAWTSRGTRVAG